MCTCEWVLHVHTWHEYSVWMPENNIQAQNFSCCHVGMIQVVRFDGNPLYQINHLTGPSSSIINIIFILQMVKLIFIIINCKYKEARWCKTTVQHKHFYIFFCSLYSYAQQDLARDKRQTYLATLDTFPRKQTAHFSWCCKSSLFLGSKFI